MKKLINLMLLTLVIGFGSCRPSCKKEGTLRCHNNKVQICGSDKNWHDSRDCSDYPNTKCGDLMGTITCVKEHK